MCISTAHGLETNNHSCCNKSNGWYTKNGKISLEMRTIEEDFETITK